MTWLRDALEQAARDPSNVQYGRVTVLAMEFLDGGGTVDDYDELSRIVAGEHAHGCALGAVPACTCGIREASTLINLFAEDRKTAKDRGVAASS